MTISFGKRNFRTWSNLDNPGAFTMYASRSRFSTDRDSDACLIKTGESIMEKGMSIPACQERGCVKVACLPTQLPNRGDVCWIGGWANSGPIMHFGVNILCRAYCNAKRAADSSQPTRHELCAGIPDRDGSGKLDAGVACKSDIGDALICDIKGKATLIGIVGRPSHTNCGKEGHLILLNRVKLMNNWISTQVTPTNSYSGPDKDPIEPPTDPTTNQMTTTA